MKKFFLLLPFLFSSCVIVDDGSYGLVRYELGSTAWQGTLNSSYSVAFGYKGNAASFTFLQGSELRSVTASYVSQVRFGASDAALYRLDRNPWYPQDYYAFYPSGGSYLYGNLNPKRYSSDFAYSSAEYVASRYY